MWKRAGASLIDTPLSDGLYRELGFVRAGGRGMSLDRNKLTL